MAQFIGGLGLARSEGSRRFLHLLFQRAQRFGGLLAVVGKFGLVAGLAQAIGRIAVGEHLPLARFLVGLFLLEPVAFAGQGVHLLRRFALLQAVHEVGGFLQTLRRAASRGAVLILGGRAFHIFLGLAQIVQSLLHALIGLLRSALLLRVA